MILSNARVEQENGIRFYEQDVLYDDYIYSGSCQIELDIDYYNTGFGIMFINANTNILSNDNSLLLFKLNHKSLEIIYKEFDLQKNLGTYNAVHSRTCTDNLKIILKKDNNIFTMSIGGQVVCSFKSDYNFDSYFIGYYSNSNNTINNISIASTIPYGWIVNMQNSNGGYIDFHRDGFELSQCNGIAEISQIEIPLDRGTYYLKYESINSDIKAYIMDADDERIIDEEKNLLKSDGSFIVQKTGLITMKFKGTKGRINNIAITTSKYNDYIRTSPDFEQVRIIDASYLKLNMKYIKKFEFDGVIKHAPGSLHDSPEDYAVIKNNNKSYGIYDLNIATNVVYHYEYENGDLNIANLAGQQSAYIQTTDEYLYIFNNVNGVITNFTITDFDNQSTNIIIETTIKEYVPAVIKSPIVVLDKDELPLDLSSSYRYYYKNGEKYYYFTNVEREYFEPHYSIFLESKPVDIDGSVIVYGIKHNSTWNLDRIYEVTKEGADTLNACADLYDVLLEDQLRYIDKTTGEIKLEDISKYKWIVVDYLKDNSYCLNYRYNLNSYEVDISIEPGAKVSMKYDNIGYEINDLRFINEVNYIDTKMVPTLNGYLTIGGGSY